MKKLMASIIIIALLFFGSYYVTGMVTEKTFKNNIDVINQSNNLFVDIDHYERGWFSSHAVLNWRIHVAERLIKNNLGQSTTIPAKDYTLQMPIDIHHGPIIFSDEGVKFGIGYAKSDLEIPQQYKEKIYNVFSKKSSLPKLTFSLSVNFLNQSQFHINLPSFKLIAKEGNSQFQWLGMESNIHTNANLDVINGSFVIDGAKFNKDAIQGNLGKVETNYNLHQDRLGLYLGTANVSIPSFTIKEGQLDLFSINDFKLTSSSDIDGGLFKSEFKASFDKMTKRAKQYGPAVLEMSIKNLDAEILGKLNAQANQLQKEATPYQQQQTLLGMLPELPKLFSKGPQFEINKLHIVMPEGTVDGNLTILLPASAASDNPLQMFQKIQGQGELRIPVPVFRDMVLSSTRRKVLNRELTLQDALTNQIKQDNTNKQPNSSGQSDTNTVPPPPGAEPAVPTVQDLEQEAIRQADERIANLLQNGLIVQQNNDYVIEINLEQGHLLINGRQFNPTMIQ